MKPCQWCNNTFTTKISYQIYCSPECRNSATKEKIAERYIASRSMRRYGKARKCKSCGKVLSAYNDGLVCLDCTIIPSDVAKILKELKGFANGKFKNDE
jgi:hypothetical protein